MGFVQARWNVPAMTMHMREVLYDRLRRDPASICTATLDTGIAAKYTTRAIVKSDSLLQSIISVTPPPDARSDPPGRFPCEF